MGEDARSDVPECFTSASMEVATTKYGRWLGHSVLRITGTTSNFSQGTRLVDVDGNLAVIGEGHLLNTIFLYGDGAGGMMAIYDGPGPGVANSNGTRTMVAGIGGNGEFLPADGNDGSPGIMFFGSAHVPGTDQPPLQDPLHGDGFSRPEQGVVSVSLVGNRAYEFGYDLRPWNDGIRSLGDSTHRFKSIYSRDIETGLNQIRLRNTSGKQDGLVNLFPNAGVGLYGGDSTMGNAGVVVTKGTTGTWQYISPVSSSTRIAGYTTCGSAYCEIQSGTGMVASKSQSVQCVTPGVVTVNINAPTVRLTTNTFGPCTVTLDTTALRSFIEAAGSYGNAMDTAEFSVVIVDSPGAGYIQFAGTNLIDPVTCMPNEQGHSASFRYMKSIDKLIMTSCMDGL